MSYYAYSDFKRKNVVFADENPINNNNNSFYCENPECRAKLSLRSRNTFQGKKTFYFSASPNHPHVEGCYSAAINRRFDPAKYDETLFDLNDVINNLMNNDFQRVHQRINTLSQIYHMAKSKSIDSLYNLDEIWKILYDIRSNKIYTKGIFGAHLVECKFHSYCSKTNFLSFKYPLDDNLLNKHYVGIDFPDEKSFLKAKKLLFNLENYPIILAGFWKEDIRENFYGNDTTYFVTDFVNQNQIYIPKK